MPKTKKESLKTKTTKETRTLKCKLTQDEVLEAADALAGALDSLRSLLDEKDSMVKSYKAKELEIEAVVTSKQLLVRNKYEFRQVDCQNVMDYDALECYVTRLDTNQQIIKRVLTEDEKQTTLPFDGEEE